jgi:hypothetical protein
LPPILAEPRSGPRSSIRFAAVGARAFRFALLHSRDSISGDFRFFVFKEFVIAILRNLQNAKMIARRSSR